MKGIIMETFVELKKERGTLRGMLHMPDNVKEGKKVPGVVLYHGFTGNRMEPKFIFVRFSRLLAQHGIASVRFDFLNSGESDGSFDKMTLSGELEDAEDILSWFSSLESIDSENIFLLGLSMGGTIAGITAGKHASKMKGLILWAPAGDMSRYIEEREQQLKTGALTGDPMDISGLMLGENFISDVKQHNTFRESSPYRGPAAVIHGTGDTSVPPSVSEKYKDLYGGNAELSLIEEADHTFQGAVWSAKLFDISLNFIKRLTAKSPGY